MPTHQIKGNFLPGIQSKKLTKANQEIAINKAVDFFFNNCS